MFLLRFGVPQTCFEIALTWSSGMIRLWIHKGSIRNNLYNKSYNFLIEEWLTLLKRKLYQQVLRPGVLGMTSPYRVKDQCYNSWEYVPTIISDRDSDLIGVRIP